MRFKFFGVPLELPFLAVSLLSCVIILDYSGKIFLCILAAIVHECGHLFSMLCFKIKPDYIKLRAFDIVICAKTDKSFLSDFLITLFGPVSNLLFSCLFYKISPDFSMINLLIGLFNLLPVESFDGGHALSVLLNRKLSFKTTNVIIKVLTFIILIPIFILGVLVLCYSKYNFSLLLISMYLLAILFLK